MYKWDESNFYLPNAKYHNRGNYGLKDKRLYDRMCIKNISDEVMEEIVEDHYDEFEKLYDKLGDDELAMMQIVRKYGRGYYINEMDNRAKNCVVQRKRGGGKIMTGPRGGKYYMCNGRKVYVKP